MSEFERAGRREEQASNTTSIDFRGKHIRVQNALKIENYILRVQSSAGEVHVVEPEEYAEVLNRHANSIEAVYTDGKIKSDRDVLTFGHNGTLNATYLAWVTTSVNRSFNEIGSTFEDRPFTYHLVTREHTREDVTTLVEKLGKRLEIK
jgi:hypothetical protein